MADSETPNTNSVPARPRFNVRRLVLAVLALAVIAVVGVLLVRRYRHRAAPAAVSGTATKPNAGARVASGTMKTTLTAGGFTPPELNQAAGPINLELRNESGQPKLVLRLEKASGERVTEVNLSDKVKTWTAKFDLAAGSYTLLETGHPEWRCRVTVQ